jgi:large subunit ribosomal protein L4e
MASRPLVTVQSLSNASSTTSFPAVLTSPIRSDIVVDIHTKMNKNHRQSYAVARFAGAQTSAQSWGTGRAVSRIPRVPGGGTHRSGQAAFGNMCRGGRMFAPTKVWRKWHVKISKGQRRYAVCSALAASAVSPLVMARGHRIEAIPEVPLVVADADIATVTKTKEALKLLEALGAKPDLDRVQASHSIRCGHGKARNRRYVQRKGPLVIHHTDRTTGTIEQAFRNIPGVELCNVERLNLLTLAPGGHVGRFVIWTETAFKSLDRIFGTYKQNSEVKVGFHPPRSIISNADIGKIINSDEVQSALRVSQKRSIPAIRKRNPLTNITAMAKVNPFALTQKRRAILAQEKGAKLRHAKLAANRKAFLTTLHTPAVAPIRGPEEIPVVQFQQ